MLGSSPEGEGRGTLAGADLLRAKHLGARDLLQALRGLSGLRGCGVWVVGLCVLSCEARKIALGPSQRLGVFEGQANKSLR